MGAKNSLPARLEEFWIDDQGAIVRSIPETKSPFPHFLLDGAHNPAGAGALKKSLVNDFSFDRLVLIWASMADKDMNGTLHVIAPLAKEIIFTQPEPERSASPEALFSLLPENHQKNAFCVANVRDAIQLAISKFLPGDMICIAGSLYLIGKARQILCGELVQEP